MPTTSNRSLRSVGVPMRSRRRSQVAVAVGAVSAVLALSACSSSGDGEDGSVDEITIGYIDEAGAPDTVVKANGWMEESFPDTEVAWVAFGTGADVIRAMASGDIDFGHAGAVPAVSAISEGVPVEIVWINSINAEAESLVVSPEIESLQDLVGKTTAVPFGTTAQYSFSVALRQANIEASDVEVLDLSPADAGAAYQRGDIDGAYTYAPGSTVIASEGGHELISSADVAADGFPTANFELAAVSFGEDHPEIVEEWIALLDRGTREYQEEQDATIQLVQDDLDVPGDALNSIMMGVTWLTGTDQLTSEYLGTDGEPGSAVETLSDMAEFMEDANQISRVPSKEEFEEKVNTSYLSGALSQ